MSENTEKDQVLALLSELSGQRDKIYISRLYIRLTGDLKIALFIGELFWLHDKGTKLEPGWFFKTYEEWEKELCLSKHEVMRAIEFCKAEHFLETRVRKISGAPVLCYHFLISAFRQWIVEKAENRIVEKAEMESEKRDYPIRNNDLLASTTSTPTNTDSGKVEIVLEEQIKNQEPEPERPETLIGVREFRRMVEQRRAYKDPSRRERKIAAEMWGEKQIYEWRAVEILDWGESLEHRPSFTALTSLAVKSAMEDLPLAVDIPPIRLLPVAKSGDQGEQRIRQTEVASPRPLPEQPPLLPPEALRWNEVVTAGEPMVVWTKNLDFQLRQRRADEQFKSKFETILAKCALLCGEEKGNFINFPWLIKDSENYAKVLQGMRWVTSRDGPGAKPKYESAADRKRNARDIARAEAEEAVRKSQETRDGKHT